MFGIIGFICPLMIIWVKNKNCNSCKLHVVSNIFLLILAVKLSIFESILQNRPEEARHVGVVCNNLRVAQPEVGINISLSDEGDIIEFSVFY